MQSRWRVVAMVVLLAGGSVWANGQQGVPALDAIKSDQELTQAIGALDKQLFDAYNTCNIGKLGSLVADDLEFYHDKTGLAVGKQPFWTLSKRTSAGR